MNKERRAIIFIVVCVAVLVAGLLLMGDRKAPAVLTRERLEALQASIEQWSREKGRLPETLDEMGLPDQATRDLLGTDFEYAVDGDGTVTLTSYGADGKPGGLMFRSDASISFRVDVSRRE